MLLNFCDPSLRTEVKCSTISTEGYEVENLVNKSEKGFMVYSCIKPPIHIDFHFICNIRISHVVIWSSVGAQKSSGFQILSKSSDQSNVSYTAISSGFLNSSQSGLIFHRSDIDPTSISSPSNFLNRRLKSDSRFVNYVSKLRISVVKTENSVPALGKVEIWGNVSPQCGKDVIASICSLWSQRNVSQKVVEDKKELAPKCDNIIEKKVSDSLEVPEDFLDPITWEIMTQPIVLPSGKVIDQSTLDKHIQNEAIWGRTSSDPFSGMPLSENRRPLAAISLKARIDQFLLENSESEEVKKLPRVLGTKIRPESSLKLINLRNSQKLPQSSQSFVKNSQHPETTSNKRKSHVLPVLSIKRKQNISIGNSRPIKKPNSTMQQNVRNLCTDEPYLINRTINCDCCENGALYKLPCNHTICRKTLLSSNNQCNVCKTAFKTSDPKRIHTL